MTSRACFAAQHKSRSCLLATLDPTVALDAQTHGGTACIQQGAQQAPRFDSWAQQAIKGAYRTRERQREWNRSPLWLGNPILALVYLPQYLVV